MINKNILKEKIIEVLEERNRGLLPEESEKEARCILSHIDVYEEAKRRMGLEWN